MNSNVIRDALNQVNEVFGVPEVGRHAFFFGCDKFPDRLVLQVKTLEGFRPVVFDPDEPLTIQTLQAVKSMLDGQTDEEKHSWQRRD